MQKPLLIFVTLGLLCIGPRLAAGGHENLEAKIALHILAAASQKSGSVCGLLTPPPCNASESNITIHGDLNTSYDVYVIATDGDSAVGIAGAEFAIKYDDRDSVGVDISNWVKCADYEYSTPAWWDTSGKGVLLTFGPTNCQDTPSTGDSLGGVTAILGVFRLEAFSPDVLSIVRRSTSGDSALSLARCGTPSTATPVEYPWGAGRVTFGEAAGELDPCVGPFSPFSEFDTLSSGELSTAQIRITDTRPNGAPTMFLHTPGAALQGAPFRDFKRVGIRYPNHAFKNGIPVTTQGLSAILDSLETYSPFTAGDVDSAGFLSITLLHTYDDSKGFEAILNDAHSREALSKVRRAVASNGTATSLLDFFICFTGLLPDEAPSDVTDSVDVSIEGFRFDNTTKEFYSRLILRNTSAVAFPAPISVALKMTDGVDFLGSSWNRVGSF
jgi:hypothetical protein